MLRCVCRSQQQVQNALIIFPLHVKFTKKRFVLDLVHACDTASNYFNKNFVKIQLSVFPFPFGDLAIYWVKVTKTGNETVKLSSL